MDALAQELQLLFVVHVHAADLRRVVIDVLDLRADEPGLQDEEQHHDEKAVQFEPLDGAALVDQVVDELEQPLIVDLGAEVEAKAHDHGEDQRPDQLDPDVRIGVRPSIGELLTPFRRFFFGHIDTLLLMLNLGAAHAACNLYYALKNNCARR